MYTLTNNDQKYATLCTQKCIKVIINLKPKPLPVIRIIIKLVDQFLRFLRASECLLGAIRVIQVPLQDQLGCPEASLRLQLILRASMNMNFLLHKPILLPSSVKPQLQPQLPAKAKLAELQPYFAFHPPPPPPVSVDFKLHLGQASSSSQSWLSKQPQLVGN